MRLSKEERTMWLEDWQQSGKSAWSYAKENGLCPQTFVKWTKTKTDNKSGFVEVPATVISPSQYIEEILIEKGDVKIHIPASIGRGELHTIFAALGDAV